MSGEEPTPHPYAHVDADKRYEWMRAECAELNSHRQAREDGLVTTIIQISSAALLAVPGFLFSADIEIPRFCAAPLLYIGIFGFLVALLSSMAEQYFSGIAHAKHIDIVQDFYLLNSQVHEDKASRQRVRFFRYSAYLVFLAALISTAIALLSLGSATMSKPPSEPVTRPTPGPSEPPSQPSPPSFPGTYEPGRRSDPSRIPPPPPPSPSEQ